MAEKRTHKVIGNKDESTKEQRIASQWRSFSRTEAYKDMMEYGDTQRAMLLRYAEELQMPAPMGKGVMPITGEVANYLLQNRRGVGIMTSYIRSRSEDQG